MPGKSRANNCKRHDSLTKVFQLTVKLVIDLQRLPLFCEVQEKKIHDSTFSRQLVRGKCLNIEPREESLRFIMHETVRTLCR